jgi:hypothetical protein
VQPGITRAGGQEGVGEQLDALLLGQTAHVEHVDRAGEPRRLAQPRVKPLQIDAAIPTRDPSRIDAELA